MKAHYSVRSLVASFSLMRQVPLPGLAASALSARLESGTSEILRDASPVGVREEVQSGFGLREAT